MQVKHLMWSKTHLSPENFAKIFNEALYISTFFDWTWSSAPNVGWYCKSMTSINSQITYEKNCKQESLAALVHSCSLALKSLLTIKTASNNIKLQAIILLLLSAFVQPETLELYSGVTPALGISHHRTFQITVEGFSHKRCLPCYQINGIKAPKKTGNTYSITKNKNSWHYLLSNTLRQTTCNLSVQYTIQLFVMGHHFWQVLGCLVNNNNDIKNSHCQNSDKGRMKAIHIITTQSVEQTTLYALGRSNSHRTAQQWWAVSELVYWRSEMVQRKQVSPASDTATIYNSSLPKITYQPQAVTKYTHDKLLIQLN